MNVRRILCVIKQPLNERDLDRFGIRNALARGLSVVVLDLSDLFHPNLPNQQLRSWADAGFQHVVANRHDGLDEFKRATAATDLVILMVVSYGLSFSSLPILRHMASMGIPYLVVAPQIYPGYALDAFRQGFSARLRDYWDRLRKMDLINSLVSRLPLSWLGVKPADYVVLASERSEAAIQRLLGPSTRRVFAHSWDYDQILAICERGVAATATAVFIDQNFPYHVDYEVLKAPRLDAKAYYRGLCAVFERIEREQGLSVIIAAHPRADYSDKPWAFDGRAVIYGQTAELIAQSKLVISHNSTAIGFAVAFAKPILLLTTKELFERQVYEKHLYIGLSKELGMPLQFYDDPSSVDLARALSIDADRYDRYLRTYLTCSTADKRPLWDKAFDALDSARAST